MIDPENRLRRGVDAAPAPGVWLYAGELRAELVGTDLRSVTWRGHEIVQRLYMAVRDAPWNTIPGEVMEREITTGNECFLVTWRQQHLSGDINLVWEGRLQGSADGELSYAMDAVAQAPFRHSKIGLNIHHGLQEYRGRHYRARTASGEVRGVLSEAIEPQMVEAGSLTAMFDHFDDITFFLDGLTARFSFEGDRFEMQDHRNWSDANFKTYGTPLSFGFPMDVAAGDRMYQLITLRVDGQPPVRRRSHVVRLAPELSAVRLPHVGHRLTHVGPPAAAVLPLVNPKHLRVELVADADIGGRLAEVRAVTAARTPLELSVLIDATAPEVGAADVAAALATNSGDVVRIVVLGKSSGFSEFGAAAPPALAGAVVDAMHERGLDIPVFSGTNQSFNELNRARPDYSGLAGVAFSLNPQVHASDDRSLMENVASLPDIAASARRLFPSAQLSVGPVHLVGPDGPFPAGPAVTSGADPALDPRHRAMFGAAWTIALLEAATRAEVEHVTLYDLVGPRGLAPLAEGADFGCLGTAAHGDFPLLWSVRRWADMNEAGSAVAVLTETPDSRCALVGCQTDGRTRLLVANRRDEPIDVRLELPAEHATVTVLDEATVAVANLFAAKPLPSANVELRGGALSMVLRAYAVVCIDVDRARPGALTRRASSAVRCP